MTKSQTPCEHIRYTESLHEDSIEQTQVFIFPHLEQGKNKGGLTHTGRGGEGKIQEKNDKGLLANIGCAFFECCLHTVQT